MALKQNYLNNNTGLIVYDAYFRISSIVTRPPGYVSIAVSVYHSESDRRDKKSAIDMWHHEINANDPESSFDMFFTETALTIEGSTLLKNSYEWLKQEDYYQNAIDC